MGCRPPAFFFGGARGLDFLNSIATPVDTPVDWIDSGEGYLSWLEQAGLVPGVLTLLWLGWTTSKNPQQLLIVALGSTGIRMFGVLLAGFLLVQTVPLYREQGGFLIWLLVFYLFTLTLEMVLLLKSRRLSP